MNNNTTETNDTTENKRFLPGERTAKDLEDQRKYLGWKKRALEEFAEIRSLRERLYPLHRSVTFTDLYKPTFNREKEKKELEREDVFKLVLQHLILNGYSNAASTLRSEASIEPPEIIGRANPGRKKNSLLVNYLTDAVRETEELWDLAIADKGDTDAVDLEEQLYHMGLGEEARANEEIDDCNVWDEDLNDPEGIIYVENETKSSNSASHSAILPKTGSSDLTSVNSVMASSHSGSFEAMKTLPEVRAGTLNRLIITLTSEHGVDPHWRAMFLMTYQSFTTPEHLFAKLRERYDVPHPSTTGGGGGAGGGGATAEWGQEQEERWNDIKKTIQLRVCNVIKKWVEEYYDDFTDSMRRALHHWIALMAITQKNHADTLTASLRKALRRQEAVKIVKTNPPEPLIPKDIWSQNLNLLSVPPLEIARQLCLMEMEIFRRIRPPELMDQAWNKAKLKWRAPNVLQSIQMFNQLSTGVSTAIVKTIRLKKRIKHYAHWLQVIDHLRQLNNFNSMLAVLAAFNASAVHRLKYTSAGVPPQYMKALTEAEAVMNSAMAFAAYRAVISSCNPPCIPYLGVHLTDLTFIDENSNFVETESGKKLINMQKRKLLYNVINKIQQFQQKEYNFHPVYQIQALIRNLCSSALDEAEMHKQSLLREPRNATKEELIQ